jgi:hypothetical protein
MTAIKNVIAKGQLVPLYFSQNDVAAAQSDVQLFTQEVASGAALAISAITMPFNGEVVAVGYDLSAAATKGSLTVGATINGTEDADTTATITTATTGKKIVPRGKCAFTAGKYLGVEITTSTGWGAVTIDMGVVLWVLLYLEGV